MSNESFKPEHSELDSSIEPSDIAINPESGLVVVVIKPDAFQRREKIIKKLEDSGLHVVKTVTKKLPDDFVVGAMYRGLPKGIHEETLKHFNSGPSEIVLLKGGADVLQQVISVTGENTNPDECSEASIRYLFGEHIGRELEEGKVYFRNAVHRAKDPKEQQDDLDKFEHWL